MGVYKALGTQNGNLLSCFVYVPYVFYVPTC
jgi:hypothetical protein